MKRLPAYLFGLAFFALTAESLAQPDDKVQEASRLFAVGQTALEAGDYARAEEALDAAFKLSPTFDVAVNLGIAEYQQKKFREAAEHLSWGLRNFPPSQTDEYKLKLNRMFEDAKGKVASLAIDVNVPGARIQINGAEAGTAPLDAAAYAEPGKCVIVATKEGYESTKIEIEIGEGLTKQISVKLERRKGPPPPEKPIWPVILMGGAAVAGAGVGVAGFVMSGVKYGEAEDAAAARKSAGTLCTGNDDCEDVTSALESSVTFRGMGIAGAVVGGVAAIGTIVYLAVPSGEAEEKTAWRFTPAIGETNGLWLEGSF